MSLEKPGDFITFEKEQFLKDYFDKEDDLPKDIQILNNMIYGKLIFNNNPISANFIFKLSDIDKLKYVRVSFLEYEEDINFKISDNNPNNKFSEMAIMKISVNAYVNLKPDEIGDGHKIINYGEEIIFTRADFTTNTTPPYHDPEGDAAYKLKVVNLPEGGTKVQLNGVDVTLNQEILFTDIDAGLLKWIPNLATTTAEDYEGFAFTISDVGSQQFY